MTPWPARSVHACVLLAFVGLTLAFFWPLPLHFSTHLTGDPAGDTGVYVWNQWVFQHELLDHRSLPYFTNVIFGARRAANLSLHNYTTFQNLVALPFVKPLGVVATFNLVYVAMTVLTAYMTFLLARQVTGRTVESFLAGLLFAISPVLVARGTAHFSLVAAAPLAAFLLLLMRMRERRRFRDAILLGLTVWWAASTDVYYAVYCVLIAAAFAASELLTLERHAEQTRARTMRWALDVLLLSLAGLVIAMIVSGGWQFTFLGVRVRMQTLYTPVLALTMVALWRALWAYRVCVSRVTVPQVWGFGKFVATSVVFAAVLLSPVIYAVTKRVADGDFDSPRIFWRSSPPGVDAASFIVPNPNHAFAPDMLTTWLTSQPNGYQENVASIPVVAIAVCLIAYRRGWRPPRWLTGLAIFFGLLSLGPFIRVLGVNTHVPGPWALLRYGPVIGLARTPTRFSVVVMLAASILFAAALAWLGRDRPRARRAILAVVALLLAIELCPVPRPLYAATVPNIYRYVAAAPETAAVLELPFGLRDGASSVGNFSALTQFFQTAHGKTVMGGYLSRVSRRRAAEVQRDPVLNALILLSEGKSLTPAQLHALEREGPELLAGGNVRFVVIDRRRASEVLRTTALHALRLRAIAADGAFELYQSGAGAQQHHSR
jgi:hypothetical protein